MKKSILIGFLSMLSLLLVAQVEDTSEAELKPFFIYRICNYVRWPNLPEEGKPFVISILGRPAPGRELKIENSVTVHNRPLVTRKIDSIEKVAGSSVLFIHASERRRLDKILAYLENKPILTISDTEGFGEKGVMVNFVLIKKQLRFEINRKAGLSASLQMDYRLIKLATKIFGHPGTPGVESKK